MMNLTTMNPETRRLIKVMPEDAARTAEMFDLLLGDNLCGRKDFIAENGYRYIDTADVYLTLRVQEGETDARKNAKTQHQARPKANGVIEGAGEVVEQRITRHAGRELHALCDERDSLPRHPGDRRLQAVAPEAAVHHV